MTLVLLKAVVLRTRPFSETSLWVRLYTRSHGKVAGIAKGGRKGMDRVLAPFTEVEVKGYPPRVAGDGLWNLARPEVNEDWRDLAGKPGLMAYAFALLEVCDRALQEAEPHEALYDTLTAALAALSTRRDEQGASVLVWFLIRLVDELGYSVQYELCARCQKPLVYPVGPFVAEAGGVLCGDCSRGLTPMPAAEWEALVALAASDVPPEVVLSSAVRDVWLSRLLGHLALHSDRVMNLASLNLLSEQAP
jgi:DNA repair protein RecO (recombination protein O)